MKCVLAVAGILLVHGSFGKYVACFTFCLPNLDILGLKRSIDIYILKHA